MYGVARNFPKLYRVHYRFLHFVEFDPNNL